MSKLLRMRKASVAAMALALAGAPAQAQTRHEADPVFAPAPLPGGLTLASEAGALPIYTDARDAAVVAHAAQDLAADIAKVAGHQPKVLAQTNAAHPHGPAIIIGTLGHNRLIDTLVRAGKLDAKPLAGQWESFVITTLANPWPGVPQALVIAGSDRRGTAFGAYELSRAMGVSPWSWWADVPVPHRNGLYMAAGAYRFGPPSVRYRGIFINDEDWGLFPWAAHTFDPAYGNIGPKTYTRVYELMLRLKANTLWPAMHKTTLAFNADPANARLADEYAIIMGSSHAEPMLRNNVGEWKAAPETFNYATNPAGVRAYWDERVKVNARYESIWTLGMRGIHDSAMVGAGGIGERVALLNSVIADQRAMLAAGVSGGLAKAQQIFVPYKEVLELYRAGLKVPGDVTIVWPDDNFGYIRQFPSEAEKRRPGGTGVYYHLSYLGSPLAYLWLSTTPPALAQEEMLRAYDEGARALWVVNVGDIKPAEIGTTHFLDMAWDAEKARGQSQHAYLADWLGKAFDAQTGEAAASLMDAYFRLNFARRPEHLEWPAHAEDRHLSEFTPAQVDARLRAFRALAQQATAWESRLPPEQRDAWFELVEFPIRAAAAAHLRFFAAERFDELIEVDPPMARSAGGAVALAEDEIAALTKRYNEQVAGGKWRGLMPAEPADSQWRIFRPRPVVTPAASLRSAPDLFLAHVDAAVPPPLDGVAAPKGQPGWRWIAGLGRGEGVAMADTPGATLRFDLTLAQETPASLAVLPLFPNGQERELKLSVSLDGGPAVAIALPRKVGDGLWTGGVLANRLLAHLPFALPAGRHSLSITAQGSGIAVEQLVYDHKGGEGH
jgi:hypothetical protein